MSKDKKKGFDLGKSDNSTSGFELNKSDAQTSKANQGQSFDLGKGDKSVTSSFSLGKSDSSESSKKMSNKAEKSKKVKPNEKGKKATSEVKTEAKSHNNVAESKTPDTLEKRKKSKALPVVLGAVVILAAAFFIFSSGDEPEDILATPMQESTEGEVETFSNDNVEVVDVKNTPVLDASEVDEQVNSPSGSESRDDVVSNKDVTQESTTPNQSENRQTESVDSPSLTNISFVKNSTTVSLSQPQLDAIEEYLSSNPDNRIVIEGYASSEGDYYYNIGLSRRRAQAVKKEFVLQGLDENRIIVEAKGSMNPIADNSTESGRAKNRRVEIRFE